MKTLVVYYSYTGHTKNIANQLAERESADIAEIKDVSRPGKFKAFTMGCFAAVTGKAWPIEAPGEDLSAYDRLILLSPVWAGNPPPAVNAFINILPEGKNIAVKMVSSGGESNCENRLKAAIEARGCSQDGFENIKA